VLDQVLTDNFPNATMEFHQWTEKSLKHNMVEPTGRVKNSGLGPHELQALAASVRSIHYAQEPQKKVRIIGE
jgi:hypothetical protein